MKQTKNQILISIDELSTLAHGSKLSEKFYQSVKNPSGPVKKYLGIESDNLAIWWSIILTLTLWDRDSSVEISDISRFLDVSMIKALSAVPELDELVRLNILRKDKLCERRRRRSNEVCSFRYYVPYYILVSLSQGETTLPKKQKEKLDQWALLDRVSCMIKSDLDNETIDYDGLCKEVENLIIENHTDQFVKRITGFKLPIIEAIILLFVCAEYTTGDDSVDLPRLLRTLFDSTGKQIQIRKQFLTGSTRLQTLNLIDLVTDNFRNENYITLTENGIDTIFQDDKKLFTSRSQVRKDLIQASSIQEKKLFYNEKEHQQLNFLTDLLNTDNYYEVINRMKKLGLKPQFTVLLHGKPGTGKTEFVYQISRLTGRDIKMVDLSQTKSKWFGDSEKITAQIFKDYISLKSESKITPILLINEIDGWLGSRALSGTSSADMTNNSMQSIILQSLEDFEGILIGTTNIWERLDKSYERRFLYKIHFGNPDSATRYQIWKDKLPDISEEELQILSTDYQFTGGQIENIRKKYFLNQLLTGISPNLDQIRRYCEEETLSSESKWNQIGFLK